MENKELLQKIDCLQKQLDCTNANYNELNQRYLLLLNSANGKAKNQCLKNKVIINLFDDDGNIAQNIIVNKAQAQRFEEKINLLCRYFNKEENPDLISYILDELEADKLLKMEYLPAIDIKCEVLRND